MGQSFSVDFNWDETFWNPEIPDDPNPIRRAALALFKARKTVVITGSGISADSGIPTFRHQGAIWQRYNMEEYGSIQAFKKNPENIWKLCQELHVDDLKPNAGHKALSKLQKLGAVSWILTQNVDSLHQISGSKDVVEFHGNFRETICLECSSIKPLPKEFPNLHSIPPLCSCGGVLKPNVTLFGEPIPEAALKITHQVIPTCEIIVVIGTSATVFPAKDIPAQAKLHGCKIIEINTEPTPLTESATDLFLQGSATEIIPQIVEEFKKLKKGDKKQGKPSK